MSLVDDAGGDRERRLDTVTADYLAAIDAGDQPDPQSILAAYPDLAVELSEFFESHAKLRVMLDTAAPASPEIGSRFGRYRLLRRLGGNMASVFEAYDTATGERVALKAMVSFAIPDATERERFLRATDALARLDHPHIVPILERGEHPGVPYFTMPLIDGCNLRTLIQRMHSGERDLAAALKGNSGGEPPHSTGDCGARELAPAREEASHWRAFAMIGIQIAQALEHAHAHEVLHRDIKPSNILMDRDGQARLIDFGLARAADQPELTETGDIAGTLRYIAPERIARNWCDNRSDLYSLGLTLYEIATLQSAYEHADRGRLLQSILFDAPKRPRCVNRDIPRPLERIITRATEKEPGDRYQSAGAFAADLMRFLDGKPVHARRAGTIRRVLNWSRRQKLQAAALLTLLLATIVATFAAMGYERNRRMTADAIARETRFGALLMQIRQARAAPRLEAWSRRAWNLVDEARSVRPSDQLRDEAAAVLVGLDAEVFRATDAFGGSSLAFDRGSRRLAIGGHKPMGDQDGRARVWDLKTNQSYVSEHIGPGAVGFRSDGVPLQLCMKPSGGLILWDLAEDRCLTRFEIPSGYTVNALALAPNGLYAAASASSASGSGLTLVWAAESGEPVCRLTEHSSSLAFSPDSTLLAGGDGGGRIRVWSLPPGSLRLEIQDTRDPILSLAFGRNPHCVPPDDVSDPLRSWRLASGDSSGTAVVWDLLTRMPLNRLRGHNYEAVRVTFSPDGTTLAVSGRQGTRMWDVASGELRLELRSKFGQQGLVFSPDGNRIAAATSPWPNGEPACTVVWSLENGRGIKHLRGLSSRIVRMSLSPNGRYVAALTVNWQLALWDVETGALLYILEAPAGFVAGYSALAFDAAETRLAYSTGRGARVWEVSTAKLLDSWTLPHGISDRIGFHPSGALISYRVEPAPGTGEPNDEREFQIHPRVGSLRELRPGSALRLIKQTDLLLADFDSIFSPHGEVVIVDASATDDRRRYVAMDGATGHVMRTYDVPERVYFTGWDPTSRVVVIQVDQSWSAVDFASGRVVWTGEQPVGRLGPDAGSIVLEESRNDGEVVTWLQPQADKALRVRLGIDYQTRWTSYEFSEDGKHLAFPGEDGLVLVAELEDLRSRMAESGLGWEARPSGNHAIRGDSSVPITTLWIHQGLRSPP
jgi:serine/threonine protein kinase/WD40 repeat protein